MDDPESPHVKVLGMPIEAFLKAYEDLQLKKSVFRELREETRLKSRTERLRELEKRMKEGK